MPGLFYLFFVQKRSAGNLCFCLNCFLQQNVYLQFIQKIIKIHCWLLWKHTDWNLFLCLKLQNRYHFGTYACPIFARTVLYNLLLKMAFILISSFFPYLKMGHVFMIHTTKGQLISKCLFGAFNSSKKRMKTIWLEVP